MCKCKKHEDVFFAYLAIFAIQRQYQFCASPLIILPPGQGLKSGGNSLVRCQHYSIPDGGCKL
jgi:hypothetical protein